MNNMKLQKTPLYVEDLLAILDARAVRAVAGYAGTCEAVVKLEPLVKLLQALLQADKEEI